MSSAAAIRLQIESALAHKIPSALTPAPKITRPVAPTGITELDDLLSGGIPVGAITELVGPDCSGRTSVALSFLASTTQEGKVCAWIDVSNALDPLSVAAAGVDLKRLLWARCGIAEEQSLQTPQQFSLPEKYLVAKPPVKGLHGGGFGPHPRTETKGLSEAVSAFLKPETVLSLPTEARESKDAKPEILDPRKSNPSVIAGPRDARKPWSRLDQAIRATDLLLQAGGFAAIVFDLGNIAPEFVTRVPLATWFRYRAAAERTQSSILLLTQHSCAKSSAELLLHLEPDSALEDEATVFTGIAHRIELGRKRFSDNSDNVLPLRRPARNATATSWQSRAAWTGPR